MVSLWICIFFLIVFLNILLHVVYLIQTKRTKPGIGIVFIALCFFILGFPK